MESSNTCTPQQQLKKPVGGPKSLQDMFNKIQLQHKQRFGNEQQQVATEVDEPQVKQTYDRGFKNTTSQNLDFESGASVMEPIDDFEEEKDEHEIVAKVKPSDVQQELIQSEINDIAESDDFKHKIDELINPTNSVRPENDTRIAVIGNVDSGKSTLVGVLTKSIMDDGRGSARKQVFNFNHEQQNGRTSSIGQEIMGFDKDLNQVQLERIQQSKNQSWAHITTHSEKLVTFLDLCGHEKYLKTTMFGLVGLMPDYAMIVVGANMGVSRMTREHLGITLALGVPFYFVITKVDICPPAVYEETLQTLVKILKSQQVAKTPMLVGPNDDVTVLAKSIPSKKMCPIFTISSVTGEGLNKLKEFLSLVPSRVNTSGQFGAVTDPVEFFIDGIYMVTGVGVVVAGTMLAGTVKPGQALQLGPDKTGLFKPIQVRSIHHKRVEVASAQSGQAVCFSIKSLVKKEQLKRTHFRKGMILVDKDATPQPIFDFEAEVVILHHATTIKPNYQAVIHCGVIRQAAKVVDMDHDLLRTGDKGQIRFRYMYRPEYLKVGTTVLFREGRTKGLGVVSRVFPPKQLTAKLAGINN